MARVYCPVMGWLVYLWQRVFCIECFYTIGSRHRWTVVGSGDDCLALVNPSFCDRRVPMGYKDRPLVTTPSLKRDFMLIVKRGDAWNDRWVTANVSVSHIWCDRDRNPEFHEKPHGKIELILNTKRNTFLHFTFTFYIFTRKCELACKRINDKVCMGWWVTFPDPAPKNTLIRLVARFFQLSGPAPIPDSGPPGATLGSDPPSMANVSGDGMFASPRNSVMFFRRRAWPCAHRERENHCKTL